MRLGIQGIKLGMTTTFDADGRAVAVTVLSLAANPVVQVKTAGRDGYDAVQLGFGARKRPTKAEAGHAAAAGVPAPAKLMEFRAGGDHGLAPGGAVDVSIFEGVAEVDVAARSKGRGFAGVIKRWGFSRGPKTHGSKAYRRPKSSGPGTTPGEVHKGKHMPGHMGHRWVTTRNLRVVSVDAARSLLLVRGATPGPNGGRVVVYPVRVRHRVERV